MRPGQARPAKSGSQLSCGPTMNSPSEKFTTIVVGEVNELNAQWAKLIYQPNGLLPTRPKIQKTNEKITSNESHYPFLESFMRDYMARRLIENRGAAEEMMALFTLASQFNLLVYFCTLQHSQLTH